MAFEKELKAAVVAAQGAGKILLKHYGKTLSKEMKGAKDFATQADLESQDYIQRTLAKQFPSYDFLGEESQVKPDALKGYAWIVDPLDGTVNYSLNLPWFCTSIALAKDGEPVVGVIYQPLTRELFTAAKKKGAFLNGRRIKVSGARLDELALGFSVSHKYENTLKIAKQIPYIQPICLRIRSIGSISEEVCNVACGRLGAYYNLLSTPWDFSAAKVIVEEAGGVTSDLEGRDWRLDSKNILVANTRASANSVITAVKKAK